MEEKKISNYVEVTASISMSKSLFIEVPEGATKEDILYQAKREILTPDKMLKISENVMQQLGVRIEGLDFKGWNVDEIEYVTDYEESPLPE